MTEQTEASMFEKKHEARQLSQSHWEEGEVTTANEDGMGFTSENFAASATVPFVYIINHRNPRIKVR